MNKKRLEEIEAKYSTLTVSSERDGIEYTEVDVKDLVFLIQNGFKQTKRVKELERELEEHKSKFTVEYTMSLRKRNKRYREAIEYMDVVHDIIKDLEGEE